MVVITFPDEETQREALGFLLGRFSGKVLKSGEHIVPEAALATLAHQNVSFTVKGKASYEQLAAAPRMKASTERRDEEIVPGDTPELEVRLRSMENAISEIQQMLGIPSPSTNWVSRLAGSLADLPEDDYHRFLECCREMRNESSEADSR